MVTNFTCFLFAFKVSAMMVSVKTTFDSSYFSIYDFIHVITSLFFTDQVHQSVLTYPGAYRKVTVELKVRVIHIFHICMGMHKAVLVLIALFIDTSSCGGCSSKK